MDIYCLNADGALLDTALLAAAGALLRLRLPAIAVNKKGRVAVRAGGIDGGADGGAEAAAEGAGGEAGDAGGGKLEGGKASTMAARRLELGPFPVALTCAQYKARCNSRPLMTAGSQSWPWLGRMGLRRGRKWAGA